MRIGFAGAGNMAAAMARGWAAGPGGPEAMLFTDLDEPRAAALADDVGGETRPDRVERARVVTLPCRAAAHGIRMA